jgi:hypothetical protein
MSLAPLVKSRRLAISVSCLPSCWIAADARAFAADGCPTSASEISTDRPDVTNSTRVVPYGSIQAENGVDWTVRQTSDVVCGTETRLRPGVAQCTEILADVPTYFYSLDGHASSGFSHLVASVKRETARSIRIPFSCDGRSRLPNRSQKISSHGSDPYIEFPWSRRFNEDWSLHGMFTVTWFTSQHEFSTTFELTLSLERDIGLTHDLFVEYVGDYPNHARPSQVVDGGGSWQVTRLQQIDFHVGFGLNSSSPDHFFGIGYSFRFDVQRQELQVI